jgi:serine/threonine protein kinase
VIWAKLKNSYIVNYNHSWFENHPLRRESILLYIQMEICETTLKDLIKKIDIEMGQNERGGTRPVGLYISCQLFLQIVKGVNYLHMQEPPIIHRDLKPSNILVIKHSKSKLLKISDFGLTTHHEYHYIDQKLTSGSHTTGVGSLKYMAPEVKRSKRYSEKSDLYSLGIVFKDLLCINENL